MSFHGFTSKQLTDRGASPQDDRRRRTASTISSFNLSMAHSSRLAWLLFAMAMAAVAFHPDPASAVDYLVGDDAGWTLNYTIGWPEKKTFKVNDNLVFKYPKGEYTVTEVDSQTFRECYRQGNAIHEWASGEDTVRLDAPGRRWFFSSVDDHCDMGLKLFVDVLVGSTVPAQPPSSAPAPAPVVTTPPPPPETPLPAPSPTTTGGDRPPVSQQAPAPSAAPPPSEKSAAALNHYKVDEAVARAAVIAGAVVAAVLM